MSRRRIHSDGPVWTKLQLPEDVHKKLTILSVEQRRTLPDVMREILSTAVGIAMPKTTPNNK